MSNIQKIFFIIVCIAVTSNTSHSQENPDDFGYEDKIRIREAYNIFNNYGNQIWKNWDTAPFALLLVTNEFEYLINHTNPSGDFQLVGYDSIIETNIYSRPRQFNKNFQATFPAVNGVSTIVIGTPVNTGRSGMDWINTVLHEHFHQLQSSRSDYYSAVDSLDLSGGDNTGMWMLNYKFPYDDSLTVERFNAVIKSAKKTFMSIDKSDFEKNLKNYLTKRKHFKSILNDKDYKYFSFQIWQEGIARYTEIKIAGMLKDSYSPGKEFKESEDYTPPDLFYTNILNRLLLKADSLKLSSDRRNSFYTLGALEGLILDRVNPDWKDLYFAKKFFVEEYYEN
ncbi:MAG: hypothetical protein ABI792_07555 [bacterium]